MRRLLTSGAAVAALLTALGGCAGSTFNSGVGDRLMADPPYYAGDGQVAGGACIAHLPIAYQADAIFDPRGDEGSQVAALLEDMNAHLASLRGREALVASLPGTGPDVRFGCEQDASGECVRDDESSYAASPVMRLAVGRPSGQWVRFVQAALDSAGADAVLVVTLEVDDYWPHQKNLRGQKEVRLGTDHIVSLPWLTSLDAPISVLQLTGALVDRDGRALRIGAEGLLARRTSLLMSGFGVQALIRDEEVAALRTARRGDLAGAPLVWHMALDHLVSRLAGGEPDVMACGAGGRT